MNKEDQGKDTEGDAFKLSAEISKVDKSVLASLGKSAAAGAVIGLAMMEKSMQGSLASALFNDYVQRRGKEIGVVALADELIQTYEKNNESKQHPGMKP